MRNNEATTDMANTPKKMKDPTEAALSAIQDALHLRDDEVPAASQDAAESGPPPAFLSARADEGQSETPWPSLRKPAAKSDLFDDEVLRPEEAAALRRPAANDDRESIGAILRGTGHGTIVAG